MSTGISVLHSHSIMERELKLPKDTVVVDVQYGKLFKEKKRLRYMKMPYFKVPILDFVSKGGIFKALEF